jgi:DNA polymerase-3 subunit chi
MTDVLFYHLEHHPLERVLPSLVEKTLERGWRAVVQAGSEERVEALDTLLWTFREDSFLPHGTRRDGNAALQPVYLTASEENPNGAQVRFLVDGAQAGELGAYARVVYLFDGRDGEAVAKARALWKTVKDLGFAVTYWQQSEQAGWQRMA